MDKKVEGAIEMILNTIGSFSFVDQAYMLGEIAERLRAEARLCLEIEYGLHKAGDDEAVN
jgi:hypothetical protein